VGELDNLRIAREAFAAWNAHEPKQHSVLLDQQYVLESDTVPSPLRGQEAHRQFMDVYLRAFPDLRFDIEQMLASGDHVITRWHSMGTHQGEFMGIPPTGRRGEGIHGCSIIQVRYGKIAHEWLFWDTATLLRQLGVLPAPQGTETH
jgi:steroid delta-isomerase-like uncharacterized protein